MQWRARPLLIRTLLCSVPPPTHPQVRQRSAKDQLLRQIPVIGRDRLKSRSMDQVQLSGAPNGFLTSGASSAQLSVHVHAADHGHSHSHSRTSSRAELMAGGERTQ